jgi:peptidoglycan/LPS O-acetylase OafA/YrhL
MVEVAPSPKPASRLAVLDGFRAVAIMLVVGFHYGVRWAPPWTRDASWLPYGEMFTGVWLLKYGRSHACFFFILSGFVILLTLERCAGVADFWRKRLARLWPGLIVCASLTTLALLVWGPRQWLKDPVSFVLSVLMIDPAVLQQHFPDTKLGWIDGAYWTLAVEARFYILVSALFLLPGRAFLPAWLGLQAASFALAWPLLHAQRDAKPVYELLLPIYLPYFTLGICLFEIYRSKRWSGLPALGALAAAAMIAVNALWWTRFPHEDPLGRFAVNAGWIALFLLFVADSPLLRPLAFKPLAQLGEASYALFLLHEAAGMALTFALAGLGFPPLLNLAAVVAVMIAASLAIYHLIEQPARLSLLNAFKPLSDWVSARAPWLDYRPSVPQPQSA